jgi:hypothetical protein
LQPIAIKSAHLAKSAIASAAACDSTHSLPAPRPIHTPLQNAAHKAGDIGRTLYAYPALTSHGQPPPAIPTHLALISQSCGKYPGSLPTLQSPPCSLEAVHAHR